MTRIFLTLASLSLILLVVAMVMGLTMGDLYAQPEPSQDTLRWATVHRLTGVAAALAVVFVESVVVTYFIGTSRWCKEVVETYRLDASVIVASNRLKRRTFPWASSGCWRWSESSPWAEPPIRRRFGNTRRIGPIGTYLVHSWELFWSPGRILFLGTTSWPITRSSSRL